MTIQWYPGHMAKAIRQLRENLKVIDIVFELVDARIPESSRNPELRATVAQKPTLLILEKSDLADPKVTGEWVRYYREHNQPVIAIDVNDRKLVGNLVKAAREVLKTQQERLEAKGIQKPVIRAVMAGIPNVGKSTLLNRLVNKKVAITGDRPGVTKKQQWLKANEELQLLDTPGVLWPKFEDPMVGKKLALTGAIKDSLFAKDDVALYAIKFMREHNQTDRLAERYHLTDDELTLSDVDLLLAITKRLGFKDDYDRASERLIFDLRKGKLGRFTFDTTDELSEKSVDSVSEADHE
ncbi:MAG: ribosome biogenesis GTPase YlqF [Furfurilactobacillus sp.]|jgi:ribosome biogenesis GTPase A|uniref:Ribosome biogenesis GTPase A n=1 Tax=Furfurilactobacillus milii TaxID=2888272 RepID=A0ABT6D844_9LACO|nr:MULTISPECIES: ribosome biogenesis GTPase YlqF [Furfurilactobacillus]QLE66547.1 50S ribosomal subunit maturation GTPase [Furfurilactobacillus rossiae]MCF6160000.1 ribosome biogenesis GTPase YlqF [Furfurilactobacillus milii]MCF6162451.1 ribosome biogenesis GTPase YlqF [Furfurilactobacillus milii]MCH4010746.1 ribosome biogenesis GTPase YlqF [Furfurilactobacillus sp.]MCH4036638.1 ribosome biogenesis GTPase YlqF [Furfurilactobacillus sp.]